MSEPLDLDAAAGNFAVLGWNWKHLSGFADIGFALIAELRKLREAHLEALEREAQTKAERDYFETEWASCARRT